MLEYIKGVKNEAPFMYFEKISKIPRASGNEGQIANYLVDFANSLGLYSYKDEFNNVLIVKNATVGREKESPIMLQAHTDMVAEKNNGTAHDFATDPIELIQQGNILRANGTTLGGDDGFGVSIMMAILSDKNISHPYLECLFTSSEEIGLVGASKFDFSKIKSRRMINLDSAEENYVIIGCCGGVRTELTLPTERINEPKKGIKLTLGGLCGGHSGEDIYKGRQNSNIVMGKIIKMLMKSEDINISSISGGDKDNAIPRECTAIIVPENQGSIDELIALVKVAEAKIKEEITANEDKSFFLKGEMCDVSSYLSKSDTEKILDVLSVANGVICYRTDIPILPDTSRNLARVRTNDDNVSIGFSSRSAKEEMLNQCTDELDGVAEKIGATTLHHERYPGWESPTTSPLVTSWQRATEKVFGKKAMAIPIHAGLECGLISEKLSGLEAISVGCNVHDLHTPQETLELDSMDKIFDTVVEFLNNKEKIMVAKTPPMGWNSWDCYGASVDEATVRKNAEYMAKNLKKYGWEYIVVDIQWYEPTADNNDYNDFADICIDEYSRVIPAENRFPSSKGGLGFKPLADYVHSLGLKFGIHIMRGVPRLAVHNKGKIKGSNKTARDIASVSVHRPGEEFRCINGCFWNTDMYGVDASKEGAKEYYDSIFELYASWGVDFVKCDDIARELPHHEEELKLISKCLRSCGRDMVFSLSPGPSRLEKSELYKECANMWRITDDFWDDWKLLYEMFERAEKWCTHSGNGHWPDADMLPFGPVRQCYDKNEWTRFNHDEHYTNMTLWSIMRSPLILGGEMTGFDDFTVKLITNEAILKMHKDARHSHQVWRKEIDGVEHILWTATSKNGEYVAVFNVGEKESEITVPLSDIEIDNSVSYTELWSGEKTENATEIKVKLNPHGAKAFLLKENL